jgi:hypothetical protein
MLIWTSFLFFISFFNRFFKEFEIIELFFLINSEKVTLKSCSDLESN